MYPFWTLSAPSVFSLLSQPSVLLWGKELREVQTWISSSFILGTRGVAMLLEIPFFFFFFGFDAWPTLSKKCNKGKVTCIKSLRILERNYSHKITSLYCEPTWNRACGTIASWTKDHCRRFTAGTWSVWNLHLFSFLHRVGWEDWYHSHICPLNIKPGDG